jgi:hypothetical protein
LFLRVTLIPSTLSSSLKRLQLLSPSLSHLGKWLHLKTLCQGNHLPAQKSVSTSEIVSLCNTFGAPHAWEVLRLCCCYVKFVHYFSFSCHALTSSNHST